MNEDLKPNIPKEPRIWAIGGGKGGVGKSVIATNLAATLSRAGNRVVLVDADLGGANLHTLLGVPNPKTNLSDFISKKVPNLSDVMTPTLVENLWLVSGARALVDMANPNFSQKGKILRHINTLDADHVVLDLGAGSAFNVLDFFLVAGGRAGTHLGRERVSLPQGRVLPQAQACGAQDPGPGSHQ